MRRVIFSAWRINRTPLVLFVLSMSGLIWALLVEDRMDIIASLLAGAPLLAVVLFLRRIPL